MSDYDVAIERKSKPLLRFNLCDNLGRSTRTRGSFRMSQFPQLAMKMAQSETEHGDREPPYASREQLDFSGGRGWDDFERDKSRFHDSYRAQTWRDGIIILGSEETYADGIRPVSVEHWFDDNVDAAGNMNRLELDGETEYYSYRFKPGTNFTAAYIYLATGIDYDNAQWRLKVDIYTDSGGKPNNSLATTGALQLGAYEQIRRLEFQTPVALSNVLYYHVVVRNYEVVAIGWEEKGNYILAADDVAASTAYKSSDGSTWAAADKGIFFRLVAADSEFEIFPFEHLGALYMALSFRDGSNPKIYMNGERGKVTSATSTTLTDSGASFTVDELIGSIVMLYDGIGAEAEKPWRLISDNTGTQITVESAWEVTPSENTKYVVIQSDKFQEITGHNMTGRITDVMTFGNIVYFCMGDHGNLYHMYDDTFDYEDNGKGSFMQVANASSDDSTKIYLARATFPPHVVTAAPEYADDDYSINDLAFTYEVLPGDYGMGKDDGSWSDYGTVNTHERSDTRAYNGKWSRYVDAGAVDSGGTQDVTVEDGAYYRITAHVYMETADAVKLEFEGSEIAATTVQSKWVRLVGYGQATGTAGTVRILSKGGNTNFYYDAVWMHKVQTDLPWGHNRITNLLVAGDPPRLHIMTDAGILKEDEGNFVEISPSELVNVRDFRNGQAAIGKGEYIYFNFLDSVVKYYDKEITILGPNLDEGLPSDRRGEVKDIISYGEWLLCAIDGGEDNISSILLHNGIGWHEYYRAPAAGLRITKLWIQSIPGNYVDRLWFNEGADVLWLGIDLTPEMNDNYRFCFTSWVDQASIYGSMGEVEKFFQAIKVTADDLGTDHYLTVEPRSESGWKKGGEPPTGETIEHLWGEMTDSPVDEISIDEFWNMDKFTLGRLQIHIGFHTINHDTTPDLRSIVVDFIEHMPVSWSYTMRLVTQDSRRSLTGERANDAVEDDLATLKEYVNSAEPVRLFTPFSFANNITIKMTSISDIEPVGYQRREDRERVKFVLSAVDA
jgi:hypothetical protein